ncbi:MAG: bifunctional (p)ppGpp synthetase/guanosine-3',5'-bis(diphosphate) 3'-pyrophosphohydrolase [Anaerolineaceae bacterium]|nr:bifunctional (p)ppGpp synthetase/guanosine-3',5'-bis(diphosphate) 3'-pyrophosphohydrolase [Anaerolineaceae bacterium]
MTHTIASDGKQFFEQVNRYLSAEDRICVQEAFALARREHGDQRRKSGELFFTHPLTVAYYISEYMLDASTLVAALLHDVAEDTRVTIDEIERIFGPEVARLVDGVTKLKDVTKGFANRKELSKQEIEDLTLHKLLAAMTSDMRVVIIKLFDRLHNMRTIKATPHSRQVYKAKETLSVYAPLANRLGIWRLKNELESLSLEVLHPTAHTIIRSRLEQIHQEQQEDYLLISGQIFDCLLQANLDVRKVFLAPENIYSVYQDLCESAASFYEVDKTMRLVVLMDNWQSCYQALGYLHQLWQPVPGTFDDYVAVARDNLYRSLHTTVVHSNGQHLKLRLRTEPMDKVSEVGVLARWLYADTPLWTSGVADRVETFFENINENINLEPQDPTAGVRGVVEDVFRQQIRVFTPRGDAVELAKGATALDFAYAIHTGLGNQCHSAYVNDMLYPLNRPLLDGMKVRIMKKDRAQPQRAWLDEDLGYIMTNYARSHARRWFRRLSPQTAVLQGLQLLQDELAMLGMHTYPHERVAHSFGYNNIKDMYYELGRAELLPTAVTTKLLEEMWAQGPARPLGKVVFSEEGDQFVVTQAEGREIRLCGTCSPRPPDAILGFLRLDGGVTVHHQRCHTLNPERLAGRKLKLAWGEAAPREVRQIKLQVKVYDRPGLLFEITQLMKDEDINIIYIHTPDPGAPNEVHINLAVEVLRPRQLVRILHQIRALANVFFIEIVDSFEAAEPLLPADSFYRPE